MDQLLQGGTALQDLSGVGVHPVLGVSYYVCAHPAYVGTLGDESSEDSVVVLVRATF